MWYFRRNVWPILNLGVVGGRREMVLKLLQRFTETLRDPLMAVKKGDRGL